MVALAFGRRQEGIEIAGRRETQAKGGQGAGADRRQAALAGVLAGGQAWDHRGAQARLAAGNIDPVAMREKILQRVQRPADLAARAFAVRLRRGEQADRRILDRDDALRTFRQQFVVAVGGGHRQLAARGDDLVDAGRAVAYFQDGAFGKPVGVATGRRDADPGQRVPDDADMAELLGRLEGDRRRNGDDADQQDRQARQLQFCRLHSISRARFIENQETTSGPPTPAAPARWRPPHTAAAAPPARRCARRAGSLP